MSLSLVKPQHTELKPRIVVFGVGGAGGNAVNNMIDAGLQGADFVVANTDAQQLQFAKTDKRVQLGVTITQGLGAGARPEVGAAAPAVPVAELRQQFKTGKQQLLDDFGCTQEELAGRIGRSRPQISNTLRLLRLPPMVARRVAAGVLSAGHARALLTLDDGAAMERLAQRIVAEGLSVRSVEEIVALGVDPERPARAGRTAGEPDPRLDDLAARLSDRFDTRARVTLGKRKGRMTIEFASMEDLHRVLGQMGVASEDVDG